ncbi:MAG: F0F1 ATP synthase subunit epsilon [Deltaproteobacteria bacterium]|nr:F0F1 ATP synthase subunit epsilon [Deltaproteobacteria bacterium]
MAGPIDLKIVTAEKQLLSEKVDEVRAPGGEGYFGVRPGHIPFLTQMEPGELWFRSGGTTQSFAVSEGFIEVSANRVTVLAESAEPAANIDVERARKALADAQGKMKGVNTNEPEYKLEAARAKRASARIAVAGRR